MLGRGHALTIDHGWREVAEKALALSVASSDLITDAAKPRASRHKDYRTVSSAASARLAMFGGNGA
jgi:hypothetical protein